MASKTAVFVLLVLLEVNSILSQCISNSRQIILQPVVQQTCTTTCTEPLQTEPYQSVLHYQAAEPIIVKPTVSTVDPCRCQPKPQYQSYAAPRQITTTAPAPTTIIIQEEEDQGMHPLLFFTLWTMMNKDCNNNDYCNRGRYPHYDDYCGCGRRNSYYDGDYYDRYNYGCNSYDRGYKCNKCYGDDGSCCYSLDKDCDGNEINLIIRPNDC